MASIERLKVIQMVRDAKKSAGTARFDISLSTSKRKELEKLYVKLDDIEDLLIIGDLSNKVEILTQSSKELTKINNKIKDTIKELEGIAEMVSAAANAVKLLVDLTVASAAILI